MFEPPGLRVIVIWIVGAVIAGVAVLASGRQSWWPAGGFCLCADFFITGDGEVGHRAMFYKRI